MFNSKVPFDFSFGEINNNNEERLKNIQALKISLDRFNTLNQLEYKLTPETTLIEVEELFNYRAVFDEQRDRKKQNSSYPLSALEIWAKEIESQLLKFDPTVPDIQKANLNDFYEQFNPNFIDRPLLCMAYLHILSGEIKRLSDYADFFTPEPVVIPSWDLDTVAPIADTITYFLKSIAIGVSLAYKYPELIHEIENLKSGQVETFVEMPINVNRAIWSGTPGEFGAILKSLIENGYIKKIKDLKTTAKILNIIFEIKDDQGEPVKFDYLYKCLTGEKARSFYPHEFKIIPSDNYNKV